MRVVICVAVLFACTDPPVKMPANAAMTSDDRCEPSAVVDCERACESYARIWSTADACQSEVSQNGQQGAVPVMVREDGAPYDPGACPRICRGDFEPGMAREAKLGWACYARSASCTEWSACYRACKR